MKTALLVIFISITAFATQKMTLPEAKNELKNFCLQGDLFHSSICLKKVETLNETATCVEFSNFLDSMFLQASNQKGQKVDVSEIVDCANSAE